MLRSLLLGAVLVLAGTFPAAAVAPITVCVWGTLTGPDTLVNGMTYGTRDYFAYRNEAEGGIRGYPVDVKLYDGRYELAEELRIYRRCVDEDRAVFVNGWSTGAAKALRDVTTRDGVPFMTESFSSEVIDPERMPFMFIAGPTYEEQIILGLRELAARGGESVVFVHADNAYGRDPVQVVCDSGVIEALGLRLADRIAVPHAGGDVSAAVARAAEHDPDLVYVQASAPQTAALLDAAAAVGLPASRFMGNFYNISPAIPGRLGDRAEGFRAVQLYAPFGAEIPAMEEIKEFGRTNPVETADVYYMKGWLQGKAMAEAIASAIDANGGAVPDDLAVFRRMVRDAMRGLDGLDVGGIAPPVSFDDHQGTTQARISEVRGGAYVPISGWLHVGY